MKLPVTSLILLSLAAAFPLHAQEYMFTYSKLYSQMKNNAKEGHDDVRLGMFFLNAETKQLCPLTKAWMEKEEHYEELDTSGFEFKVPLDSNLKSANPLVYVQMGTEAQCDFSMVVMANEQLSGEVTYQDIEKLLPQMQVMLEDLGGMFASWFTPNVEGVTLEFADGFNGSIDASNGKSFDIIDGRAYVELARLAPGASLMLPKPTTRVLPWLPNAN